MEILGRSRTTKCYARMSLGKMKLTYTRHTKKVLEI